MFRQYLREADKLILDHQFQNARQILASARALFPSSPYLAAFEERIAVFEAQKVATPPHSPMDAEIAPAQPGPVDAAASSEDAKKQLEKKLRSEIENEYRDRYTEELRKAEEQARVHLEQERLNSKPDPAELERVVAERVVESRRQFEQEYQEKMRDAVAEKERQFEQELAQRLQVMETEISARTTARYSEEKQKLEEKLHADQQTLLDRERRESEAREKQLQEDHAKALRQASDERKRLQTQTTQQIQEYAELKERLAKEHESAIAHERSAMELHYAELNAKLTDQFQHQQEELKKELDRQLRGEVDAMRQKEASLLEERRAALQRELESQFRDKYEKLLETERGRIEAESLGALDQEKQRLHTEFLQMVEKQDENVRQMRKEIEQRMEQEFVERLSRLAHESEQKLELLGARLPESHSDRLALYRTALRPFYESGMPSAEQMTKVMQLKELLELTFDEHLEIESEIRLDLFTELLQKEFQAGTLQATDTVKLDELKERFGITPEQGSRLEPRLLALLQKSDSRRTILVADDEQLLLSTIADHLQGHGYHVITAATVQDALEKVMKSPVDLILSDIKFGSEELDGFKFFEAVQRVPSLCTVPFIFMSSLRDGVIVRSGMLMGIDDYLTKPLDPELLLAVIEGKLRRVRAMAGRQKA
jgi:CheY-like chemotaxis protein